ncbi:MAG: Asp-tRNA(Asn)/Glu-tRNA(Gln) amidotransferase subunit GatB [Patescibacteria group bacterium]
MPLIPIIGLEIHIQLKTNSKMFCGCPVNETETPNTNVCPVCLGHPGVLPVPNEQAVRFAVLLGQAIEGTVAENSKFDRKNYFYPDLPKGYQISQFDMPVISGGHLDVSVPGGARDRIRVRFVRAHLEEDAAKNTHVDGFSFVDFNRGGTPLLECVTEPDLRSAEEAKIFLQELRLLIRTLGVSEGDMERGQLRCDANISLREVDEKGAIVGLMLNPKTEVKNINSFRNVERALLYEIQRQTKLWEESGAPQATTTRGWDDIKQRTVLQRIKEDSADYRYFPEPDIPPLSLVEISRKILQLMPELPEAKRFRFQEEYGFGNADVRHLTDDATMAVFTEQVMSELSEWTGEEVHGKMAKLVASWLINKLGGLHEKISAENFAELMKLLAENKVTGRSALTILEEMKASGKDPSQVMEDAGLGRMDNETVLAEIVDRVLEANPTEVERYKNGEKKLAKFFIGMIIRETEGNADPETASRILHDRLSK